MTLTSFFQSPDSLQTFIFQSPLQQFKTALPHFSYQELSQSFFLLKTGPAKEAQNKLEELFQFIDSPTTLEQWGRHLLVSHFLVFLDFLNQHSSYQNRLPFILVGLSPTVFSQALSLFQEDHVVLFKYESLLEPLQYHLTQVVHQGESLYHQTEQAIQQLKQEFHVLNPTELTPETLNSLMHRIETLRSRLLNYLDSINTALSIVWHNTGRIDLIEKLSHLKESLHHQLNDSVGMRRSDSYGSTGLYFTLEQIGTRVFDSLEDSDASTEGLTRLSIWYLKDYWDLGLLPFIHQVQELDLDANQSNEKERQEYHQHLFLLVQQQLNRLHIGTVSALKKAYLYSKPLLKKYIHQNQHLLR